MDYKEKIGIYKKYLKIKNLIESVANISDYIDGFRKLRNCPSAWCSCLPMAITSSFQLRFAHRLKRWTPDFPIFEKIYSMYKMDSIKCSKYVLQLLSLVHVRFLYLFFLLAFLIWLWQRVTKIQSLVSSWIWASTWFVMNYTKIFLILGLLWW